LNAFETLLPPYENYVNNFEHAVVSDESVRSDFLKDTKEEFAVTSKLGTVAVLENTKAFRKLHLNYVSSSVLAGFEEIMATLLLMKV